MRIIDGNNLLHRLAIERVGYGVHPVRQLYNRLCSPPETTIVVWDGPSANKRRKEIFPEYKANRRPKEESKYQFFGIAKGVLRFTPCIQIEVQGWEADDVIGTLINRYHRDHDITVETNDGDYWQHKDKCHLPLVSKKWHSFSADTCLLFKATVGESKDNVTGVRGFGPESWKRMTERQIQQLIVSIKLDDFLLFVDSCYPYFPPAVKKAYDQSQLFEQIKLCWKLNQYWPVPEEEIDAAIQRGTTNFDAAEIFMEKFLI